MSLNSKYSIYGNVNIKIIDSPTRQREYNYHNSGTEEFFKYLLTMMLSGETNINQRPGHIDIIGDDGSSLLSQTVLYSDTTRIETAGGKDPYAKVSYNFFIPYTLIKNKSRDSFKKLLLKSIDSSKTYAELELAKGLTLTSTSNIEATWTIKLSNGNEATV